MALTASAMSAVLCQVSKDSGPMKPLQVSPLHGDILPHQHQPQLDATSAVQSALNSVVLISVDNIVWGSGVLISKNGLILTNAHLVEPWRQNSNQIGFLSRNKAISGKGNLSVRVLVSGPKSHQNFEWFRGETVFVSSGPLDVAVVKIHADVAQFQPISTEARESPSLGDKVFAIGHGIFGPSLGELRFV